MYFFRGNICVDYIFALAVDTLVISPTLDALRLKFLPCFEILLKATKIFHTLSPLDKNVLFAGFHRIFFKYIYARARFRFAGDFVYVINFFRKKKGLSLVKSTLSPKIVRFLRSPQH